MVSYFESLEFRVKHDAHFIPVVGFIQVMQIYLRIDSLKVPVDFEDEYRPLYAHDLPLRIYLAMFGGFLSPAYGGNEAIDSPRRELLGSVVALRHGHTRTPL